MCLVLFRRSARANVNDSGVMTQFFSEMMGLFQLPLIGNRQLQPTFPPAARQHFAAISGLHSLSEPMDGFPAAVMRLKCTFHRKTISYLRIPPVIVGKSADIPKNGTQR